MKRATKELLFPWLDGWQEETGADDMPDGAWEAMMKEGVEAFNEQHSGYNLDPHDAWLAWVMRNQPNTEKSDD